MRTDVGVALLYRLRNTPLALQVHLRPAEPMAQERPLQSDSGPLAPSLQPSIVAELGHGNAALEACIVEGAPGSNGGNAQYGERDAPRRRRESGPEPGNERSAGEHDARPDDSVLAHRRHRYRSRENHRSCIPLGAAHRGEREKPEGDDERSERARYADPRPVVGDA